MPLFERQELFSDERDGQNITQVRILEEVLVALSWFPPEGNKEKYENSVILVTCRASSMRGTYRICPHHYRYTSVLRDSYKLSDIFSDRFLLPGGSQRGVRPPAVPFRRNPSTASC